MKPLQRLDPTWWCRTPRGYQQQDGRAELLRRKTGCKISWELYIEGDRLGEWRTLRLAKLAAGLLRVRSQKEPQEL